MTRLNQTQSAVLHSVATSEDGIAEEAADRRTTGSLIKRRYLQLVSQDAGACRLVATPEGRAAIGLDIPDKVAPIATVAAPQTKSFLIRALLERPEGATIAQMSEATGWLGHSVRGFLAGTLKKKLGLQVASEKADAGRVYRIAAHGGEE